MGKTKLISILLASVAASSAFADAGLANGCANPSTPYEALQCAKTAYETRANNAKAEATNVYNTNYATAKSIYDYFNTKGRGSFNFNALAQSVYYVAAVAKTTGPDAVNIGKAIKGGDLNSVPALVSKLQADRAALLASGSKTEFAAKGAVYLELEAMAKAELGSKGNKNNELKISNYAMNMYYAYYAPALAINTFQFVKNDAPKYMNSTLSTMTQQMCEEQVTTAQKNIQALQQVDPIVDFLIDSSKPNSFLKNTLKSAGMTYASDAMDVIYSYSTAMSANVSGQPYNVCDYNTFTASANSNMYTKVLNDTVNKVSQKINVPAQNIYWALAATSAIALDSGLVNQPAPVAGAGILPF